MNSQEMQDVLKMLLPEKIKEMCTDSIDTAFKEEMERYMINDKKAQKSGKVRMPILRGPGKVSLEEIYIRDLLSAV